MGRLIHYLRPYRGRIALALTFVAAMTVAELMVPRLVQRIIDQGIARNDMGVIRTTALWMLGVALVEALFTIVNNSLSVEVAVSSSTDIREALFAKVQALAFGNLDRLQTGNLIVRLTSDISQVEQLVLLSLRMLARTPLLFLGSLTLLIATSPRLALILLVLLPAMSALVYIIVTRGHPLFRVIQQRLDRLNTILQENLSGIRVVKAFVRAEHEGRRFDEANSALMQQHIKVGRLFSMIFPSLNLCLNLGILAVLWFGGLQVQAGTMSVGQTVAFVNYLMSTMFPIMMMGMMVNMISAAQVSAQRIVEVLDSVPEIQEMPGARSLENARGRVAFEDVCSSYNGDCHEPVLNGISLIAEPGQKIALLGATGSGKSSLVHMIPRFYDATSGRITIDGIDVRELKLASLRSTVGVALQEAVLFSGTIRDNIRYGRPEASDEEVVAAAKAAQAHDFVVKFPEGYDSLVGQRGVNLSGGQKQRIAIARALLIHPAVLILDDSTSAVDIETEEEIEKALDGWMEGHTSFVIAQRVSTVLNADKIVVLERGKIVAVGSHAELIASSPIYREIYDSQLGDGGTAHVQTA